MRDSLELAGIFDECDTSDWCGYTEGDMGVLDPTPAVDLKPMLEKGKTYKISYTVHGNGDNHTIIFPTSGSEFTVDSVSCVEVTPPKETVSAPRGMSKSYFHLMQTQRKPKVVTNDSNNRSR